MASKLTFNNDDIIILTRLLESSERIGIVSHSRPDGDAAGCCVAIFRFLGAIFHKKKDCRILLENGVPDNIDFLWGEEEKNRTLFYCDSPSEVKEFVSACDLLICLDLAGLHRTGSMQEAFEGCTAHKILIDHHLNPDRDSFDITFSITEISSASELLYHILARLASDGTYPLPQACLEPILTGITTDTNNFDNSVYSTTLAAVSELLEAGVDRDSILYKLYNRCPERRIRLMGKLLSENLTILDNGVAYMILDAETIGHYGIKSGETEGFVNIPLTIDRVKISIFIKQDGDIVRVSIRSMRGISANLLASRHFHGGGHEQAAGGRLDIGTDVPDFESIPAYVAAVTSNIAEYEA